MHKANVMLQKATCAHSSQ